MDDYHILENIGQGAFGKVFKVRRIQNNQIYALKKIPIQRGNAQDVSFKIFF